jgi:hypothetical protein
MSDTILWSDLPWPRIKARVQAGAPVFLPLGSTEQHGHHMSVNVDVVIPSGICARGHGTGLGRSAAGPPDAPRAPCLRHRTIRAGECCGCGRPVGQPDKT